MGRGCEGVRSEGCCSEGSERTLSPSVERAVDGERLRGRPLGRVLQRGKRAYTLTLGGAGGGWGEVARASARKGAAAREASVHPHPRWSGRWMGRGCEGVRSEGCCSEGSERTPSPSVER